MNTQDYADLDKRLSDKTAFTALKKDDAKKRKQLLHLLKTVLEKANTKDLAIIYQFAANLVD